MAIGQDIASMLSDLGSYLSPSQADAAPIMGFIDNPDDASGANGNQALIQNAAPSASPASQGAAQAGAGNNSGGINDSNLEGMSAQLNAMNAPSQSGAQGGAQPSGSGSQALITPQQASAAASGNGSDADAVNKIMNSINAMAAPASSVQPENSNPVYNADVNAYNTGAAQQASMDQKAAQDTMSAMNHAAGMDTPQSMESAISGGSLPSDPYANSNGRDNSANAAIPPRPSGNVWTSDSPAYNQQMQNYKAYEAGNATPVSSDLANSAPVDKASSNTVARPSDDFPYAGIQNSIKSGAAGSLPSDSLTSASGADNSLNAQPAPSSVLGSIVNDAEQIGQTAFSAPMSNTAAMGRAISGGAGSVTAPPLNANDSNTVPIQLQSQAAQDAFMKNLPAAAQAGNTGAFQTPEAQASLAYERDNSTPIGRNFSEPPITELADQAQAVSDAYNHPDTLGALDSGGQQVMNMLSHQAGDAINALNRVKNSIPVARDIPDVPVPPLPSKFPQGVISHHPVANTAAEGDLLALEALTGGGKLGLPFSGGFWPAVGRVLGVGAPVGAMTGAAMTPLENGAQSQREGGSAGSLNPFHADEWRGAAGNALAGTGLGALSELFAPFSNAYHSSNNIPPITAEDFEAPSQSAADKAFADRVKNYEELHPEDRNPFTPAQTPTSAGSVSSAIAGEQNNRGYIDDILDMMSFIPGFHWLAGVMRAKRLIGKGLDIVKNKTDEMPQTRDLEAYDEPEPVAALKRAAHPVLSGAAGAAANAADAAPASNAQQTQTAYTPPAQQNAAPAQPQQPVDTSGGIAGDLIRGLFNGIAGGFEGASGGRGWNPLAEQQADEMSGRYNIPFGMALQLAMNPQQENEFTQTMARYGNSVSPQAAQSISRYNDFTGRLNMFRNGVETDDNIRKALGNHYTGLTGMSWNEINKKWPALARYFPDKITYIDAATHQPVTEPAYVAMQKLADDQNIRWQQAGDIYNMAGDTDMAREMNTQTHPDAFANPDRYDRWTQDVMNDGYQRLQGLYNTARGEVRMGVGGYMPRDLNTMPQGTFAQYNNGRDQDKVKTDSTAGQWTGY